jgi:glycosyltransferase involved in cell wall biosynthesis
MPSFWLMSGNDVMDGASSNNSVQYGGPAPIVSVIIPTMRRPDLLRRALRTVLDQTCQSFEIIVVIDGPDSDTVRALQAETDARIRVFKNAQPLGAGRARNIGVAKANGRYVAFLDDDDEWLPAKLEEQLSLAGGRDDVLVTCLSKVIRPQGIEIWPSTIYDNTRPFDEYLFDRRKPFAGDAFIQSSSQFLSRDLFQRSPFPERSPHDDWEFVIRLACGLHIRVETVPSVLVVHYVGAQAQSLSNKDAWKASLAWIAGMRQVMTPRAYGGFCLGVVGPRAASERDYKAIFPILSEAFRNGAPRALTVLFFIVVWLIPEDVRKRIRLSIQRRKSHAAAE